MTTETEVRAMVSHAQQLLGLADWDVHVHIGECPDEMAPGQRLAGAAVAYPEYKSGDIYFDLEQIAFDHADLTDVIRHELLHLVVSPLAALADDWAEGDPGRAKFSAYVNEQVVTHLERMPLWRVLDPEVL